MNRIQIEKRIKTALIYTGIISALAGLSYLSENVENFGLSEFTITLTGIIIAQVTKYLKETKTSIDSKGI